jgi:hypothetical protein
MTVRREKTIHFSSHPEAVRAAIDAVLSNERKYRLKHHHDDVWTIRVHPVGWPLVLSTRLDIGLTQAVPTGAIVSLSTTSQRLIVGDIFGMYNGYLNDLTTALKAQLTAA